MSGSELVGVMSPSVWVDGLLGGFEPIVGSELARVLDAADVVVVPDRVPSAQQLRAGTGMVRELVPGVRDVKVRAEWWEAVEGLELLRREVCAAVATGGFWCGDRSRLAPGSVTVVPSPAVEAFFADDPWGLGQFTWSRARWLEFVAAGVEEMVVSLRGKGSPYGPRVRPLEFVGFWAEHRVRFFRSQLAEYTAAGVFDRLHPTVRS